MKHIKLNKKASIICNKNKINLLIIFLLLSTQLFANKLIVRKQSSLSNLKTAIKLANDNDTIIIKNGIYYENEIVINKSLTLLGENFPTIDGENKSEIFLIKADDVTVKGLRIINTAVSFIHDNAAIKLEEVKNCSVKGNILENNFFAVYVSKSEDCQIEDNKIIARSISETNSGNGIHAWYCRNIVIKNNVISGHRDGVYLEFVHKAFLSGNNCNNNLRYGLHFMFSDSSSYSNNIFENNGAGVAIMYTKFIIMSDNLFLNNWGPASYGILLKEIYDTKIYSNKFIENTTALYLEGCTRIQVVGNQFENNGWAVNLMSNSNDNIFKQNNFLGNSFDVATSSRQNFNLFEGNYWSAYKGYDLDKDNVGDIPYRPVKLFSLIAKQQPAAIILLNSFLVDILNIAESVLPSITPAELVDLKPNMRKFN